MLTDLAVYSPILVTGATGFVGSAVARALIAAGASVRVLARPNSDRRNLAGLPVTIVDGDLDRPETLPAAVEGCRALCHVAADYRLWVRHPDSMLRTNVEGTRALMQAALKAGIARIVYTSSVATLGLHADGSPADETSPVTLADMIGIYKRSKFLAEAVVTDLIATAGLPAVIVHPSTPIGPRDVKPTPTGRIIIEAAMGRMPAFVDTGLNLVHVDDVAAGHLAALTRGTVGRRYILGGENLSLAALLAEIAGLTGRRAPTLRLNRRLVYPLAWGAEAAARLTGRDPFVTRDALRMAAKWMYFSSQRAVTELGYQHRPITSALREAIDWFRAEGMLR